MPIFTTATDAILYKLAEVYSEQSNNQGGTRTTTVLAADSCDIITNVFDFDGDGETPLNIVRVSKHATTPDVNYDLRLITVTAGGVQTEVFNTLSYPNGMSGTNIVKSNTFTNKDGTTTTGYSSDYINISAHSSVLSQLWIG